MLPPLPSILTASSPLLRGGLLLLSLLLGLLSRLDLVPTATAPAQPLFVVVQPVAEGSDTAQCEQRAHDENRYGEHVDRFRPSVGGGRGTVYGLKIRQRLPVDCILLHLSYLACLYLTESIVSLVHDGPVRLVIPSACVRGVWLGGRAGSEGRRGVGDVIAANRVDCLLCLVS